MTSDPGERTEPSRAAAAAPRRRIALLALVALVALLGWVTLVRAAIDAGSSVRSEEPASWVRLALTTTGGAVCLLVALLLGMRAIGLARGRGRGQGGGPGREVPTRPRGGSHAAR